MPRKKGVVPENPGRQPDAANSLAVDAAGGIYIASGSKQPRLPGVKQKLVWKAGRVLDAEGDGAWTALYDSSDWPPAIKAGTRTGSTPTLMGFGDDRDRLVLMTDGASRMKCAAFWRDAIRADARAVPGALSPRIADRKPVLAGISEQRASLQSEQTIIVSGHAALVVNDLIEEGHPDRIIDVMTVGPVHSPPRGDVVSGSKVAVISSGASAVFVTGYRKIDGTEVTGLVWTAGGSFRAPSLARASRVSAAAGWHGPSPRALLRRDPWPCVISPDLIVLNG